jgi:hypothetical protein
MTSQTSYPRHPLLPDDPLDLTRVYTPHDGQKRWHASTAKNKILRISRRGGKSRWALFEMLRRWIEALEVPAPEDLVPPWHCWIVVPSNPQGRQTWNELVSLIPKGMIYPNGIKEEDNIIYLQGTPDRPWGLIELKSGYLPDSLQTVGLDVLWVNEAQDLPNEAFHKLLPTLRSPHRTGYAIYEGIPALYRDHWFQRIFEVAERGRDNYEAFAANIYTNPFLTPKDWKEIEEDRDLVPEAVWNRMYLAEFSEKAAYLHNIDACVAGDLLPEPIPGARYVGGLDIGRIIDPSVFIVMDAVERKVVHRVTYDAGQSWVIQREGAFTTWKKWGCEKVVVDATAMGGDMFCEQLTDMGIPVEEYVFTATSRKHLLDNLAISTERETVRFPPIPALLRQLRALQPVKQPGGSYKVEAPKGEHDDEVFALAMALYACDNASPTGARPAMRSYRYLPTQGEVNGGVSSATRRLLSTRRSKRFAERAERGNVEVSA